MKQDQQRFDPLQHGISRRFLTDDGNINTASWTRATQTAEVVGTCRECGDSMLAEPSHENGKNTWYSAYCVNRACGHEIASPGGAALRRSSRHEEMPDGYWAKRTGGK